MNWNDIRYLIAVAEHGSLHSAAKSMGVNHSTAWRRVQALEKALGCQLFIADRQGYYLTEQGHEALKHARLVADQMNTIALETGGKNVQMQGLIRITAPGSFAWTILPKMIYKFRQIHPLVEFDIIETAAALAIEKREADIAVRATHQAPDNLIGRKLYDIPWGIYAHKAILKNLNLVSPMSIEQLQSQDFIAYRHFDIPVNRWFNHTFKNNRKLIYCNSVNAMQGAAQEQLGFALLPVSLGYDLEKVYQLDEKFNSGIWLLAHPEMRNAARIKAFWDFLIEQEAQDKGFLSLIENSR